MSPFLRRRSTRNLLDFIPLRQVEHEIDSSDGRVTLLLPRFRNRVAKRLFGGLNKSPLVRLRLDEVGSFLWLHIDGSINIKELAEAMQRKFGERVEPVYQRVAVFARNLQRQGLLEIQKPNTPEAR